MFNPKCEPKTYLVNCARFKVFISLQDWRPNHRLPKRFCREAAKSRHPRWETWNYFVGQQDAFKLGQLITRKWVDGEWAGKGGSVTKLLDYFFQYLAINNNEKLPNSIRNLPNKVYQTLNGSFKICQSRVKFCLSGESLPNLVTRKSSMTTCPKA